jgi:hypothetical protein
MVHLGVQVCSMWAFLSVLVGGLLFRFLAVIGPCRVATANEDHSSVCSASGISGIMKGSVASSEC